MQVFSFAVRAARCSLHHMCGRGEIGKRNGLKIRRPQGLAGSSPAVRTIVLSHGNTLRLYLRWGGERSPGRSHALAVGWALQPHMRRPCHD